jgi:hypothetical protein
VTGKSTILIFCKIEIKYIIGLCVNNRKYVLQDTDKMNRLNTQMKQLPGNLFLGVAIILFSLIAISCSGDSKQSATVTDNSPEVQTVAAGDPGTASGMVVQTTCLECHPAIKDGGFNIDLQKVKKEGMLVGKGMELKKNQSASDDK